MKFSLKIWRQKNVNSEGRFDEYSIDGIGPDVSFLEMLDILNENLIRGGRDTIAFDHDCREGICGMCSLYINGRAHGPSQGTATCQLYMRTFKDQDRIVIEPWRARAFPVIKDLIVDRSALDRIIEAGGFISVNTGSAPEANTIPIAKDKAEVAMDAAQCIGCGACVAACKNSSAMLFTAAKVSHLISLPQGHPERSRRVLAMVKAMDLAGFGHCSNTYACEAECPKQISVSHIARLNREYIRALT